MGIGFKQHGIALSVLGLLAISGVSTFVVVKTHADKTAMITASAANVLPTAEITSITNDSNSTVESDGTALTLTDGAATPVHVKGNVTDLNGCADLVGMLAVIYHGSQETVDCVGHGGGSSELLADGGFEHWSDASTPSDWAKTVAVGAPTLDRESTIIHSGAYAAKITGTGSGPDILALESSYLSGKNPGDTVTFSGWVTNNGDSGNGSGGAFFLNGAVSTATEMYDFASSTWISISMGNPWSTAFGGNPADYIQSPSPSGAWVQFTGTLPIPANGTIEMLAIGIPSGGGAFISYLDDYSMTMAGSGGDFSPGATDNGHCAAATGSRCQISSCSGTTGQFDCTVPVWFNADSTGTGGDYESDSWNAVVAPLDTYLQSSMNNDSPIISTARPFEVASLTAISLSGNIAFGKMDLNSTTSSVPILTENTGNKHGQGVSIATAGMTCTPGSISASNIHFATSDVAFDSMTSLHDDASAVSSGLSLSPLATTSTIMTSSTYFNLHTPPSGIAGDCTGTLTFSTE